MSPRLGLLSITHPPALGSEWEKWNWELRSTFIPPKANTTLIFGHFYSVWWRIRSHGDQQCSFGSNFTRPRLPGSTHAHTHSHAYIPHRVCPNSQFILIKPFHAMSSPPARFQLNSDSLRQASRRRQKPSWRRHPIQTTFVYTIWHHHYRGSGMLLHIFQVDGKR